MEAILVRHMFSRRPRFNPSQFLGALLLVALANAQQPSAEPKPEPATRPEIKRALEALKQRTPRLPLPSADGETDTVNNGRMRELYLPDSWGGRTRNQVANGSNSGGGPGSGNGNSGVGGRRGWGGNPDAKLDNRLSVSCFWIVSRGNNCHYCLGHQELKLRDAGMEENVIAALDCDWDAFDPRTQAALAYARKLTLEPQRIDDQDIRDLQKEFSDPEIIELTFSIARFNGTNRWTDGLGIPQDSSFHGENSRLDTPTDPKFQQTVSRVAPSTRAPRLPPLPWEEVQSRLAQARVREPRVAITSLSGVGSGTTSESTPQVTATPTSVAPDATAKWNWELVLEELPASLRGPLAAWNTILDDDHLPRRLKAELAFIAAHRNYSWYAAGHAIARLQALGVTDSEIAALCQSLTTAEAAKVDSAEAVAHGLAVKLTEDPHRITDADLATVRARFSDAETAQIVQVICVANLFDRFTEPLGLTLEASVATDAH